MLGGKVLLLLGPLALLAARRLLLLALRTRLDHRLLLLLLGWRCRLGACLGRALQGQ